MQVLTEVQFIVGIFSAIASFAASCYLLYKWKKYPNRLLTDMPFLFGVITLLITANQVFIKKGILGDKITQSTKGMQVFKTIDDVFEYFVLKSGDITLNFPQGGSHPTISLPNVMNINQKVEDIQTIISRTEVDIH